MVSFVFLAAVNWTRLYPHHIRRLTSSNFTISHHFWHFSSTDYFSDSLWLFRWSSIHGCIDKTTSQLMNRWCHLNRANTILMSVHCNGKHIYHTHNGLHWTTWLNFDPLYLLQLYKHIVFFFFFFVQMRGCLQDKWHHPKSSFVKADKQRYENESANTSFINIYWSAKKKKKKLRKKTESWFNCLCANEHMQMEVVCGNVLWTIGPTEKHV